MREGECLTGLTGSTGLRDNIPRSGESQRLHFWEIPIRPRLRRETTARQVPELEFPKNEDAPHPVNPVNPVEKLPRFYPVSPVNPVEKLLSSQPLFGPGKERLHFLNMYGIMST